MPKPNITLLEVQTENKNIKLKTEKQRTNENIIQW